MSPDLSAPYATPLRLEPGSAPLVGRTLLCVFACAGAFALLSPGMPPAFRYLSLCWLLIALRWQWPRQVSRTAPDCIAAVTWLEGRACRLRLRSGRELDATLGDTAFVQPRLVIVNFRLSRWRRRYLLLLPGMVDSDSFRRLRVRLRMELRR